MRLLFLESYYGGSHREFADGLCRSSRHDIELVTLNDRHWRWRMRGAALQFARAVPDPGVYDGLIVTSLLSLAELRGIWGTGCPPALVYFHENQVTYPLPAGKRRDSSFGFTNLTTALAADRVLFNSRFHLEEFLAGAEVLIEEMPDHQPRWIVETLAASARVLHPGCRLEEIPPRQPDPSLPPLIIWNHRWEYDKNPESFFDALDDVVATGVEFRLALLGESLRAIPKTFLAARERYGDRVLQFGYAPTRVDYLRWLARGDVVVSTAVQENFGIAVVEAVAAGCAPLLPRRLAYPEVIPEEFHAGCLYDDQPDLVRRLVDVLRERPDTSRLAAEMNRYSWEKQVDRYDRELGSLVTTK